MNKVIPSIKRNKNNNDVIGQYINEKIIRDTECNDRMGIAKNI